MRILRWAAAMAAVMGWIGAAGAWAESAPAGTPVVIDAIAIRVGNDMITRLEIEEPLRQLRERISQQFRGADLEKKMKEAREQHVKRLIEDKLLLLEARAQNLEATDTQVTERAKQAVQALRNQYASESDFKRQLETEHLTLDDLQTQQETLVREQMLRQRLYQAKVQELSTGADLAEEQLRKYYTEHQDEFRRPARANVAQVFVAHPDTGLPAKTFEAQDAQALAKIERAKRELTDGETFAAVARKYSEHKPTAEKGGEVGWLAKGEVGLPEFDREVFERLKIGEVSPVINTARGFFLLRVSEREDGSLTPFAEVRGRIRQMLMSLNSESRLQNWIEQLKQKYPVVYEDKK